MNSTPKISPEVKSYMTMFEQLEETILFIVNESTGIKATELCLRVLTKMTPKEYKNEEYNAIVQSIIDRGLIVELEYEIPQVPDRIKSMYFPKGSIIYSNPLMDRKSKRVDIPNPPRHEMGS